MKAQRFIQHLLGEQTGTQLPHISSTDIASYSLPLPPREEQDFIASEVERRFSIIDRLEDTIEESLKRAESLRQSILKRAFSGELVEQEPEDEPASVLLERIQEERGASEQSKKGRFKKGATEEPSLFSGAGS